MGPVIAPDATPAQLREQTAAYFERWYGSPVERQAVEVLVAHRLNGARAECMGQKGYDWPWDTGVMPAVPLDPLMTTGWFAAPHEPPRSKYALAWAPFHRAEIRMNADEGLPPAEDDAMTQCLKATPSAGEDELEAIRHPEALQTLAAQWFAGLAKVSDSFGPRSDYADCMTEQRVALLDGKAFSDEGITAALVEAQPPASLIPIGNEPPSDEWTHFIALEKEVTDADWRCRSAIYERGIRDLIPVINQFASTHEDEVQRLEGHWDAMLSEAESLGYRPDKPLRSELAVHD